MMNAGRAGVGWFMLLLMRYEERLFLFLGVESQGRLSYNEYQGG